MSHPQIWDSATSFIDYHIIKYFCNWVLIMQALFPNHWGEISLTMYLSVSIIITHSFPSRRHGHASSPGAICRRRPTCLIPGEVSLFGKCVQTHWTLLTVDGGTSGKLMVNRHKTTSVIWDAQNGSFRSGKALLSSNKRSSSAGVWVVVLQKCTDHNTPLNTYTYSDTSTNMLRNTQTYISLIFTIAKCVLVSSGFS